MTCRKVTLGDKVSNILHKFFPTYYTTMSKEERVKSIKIATRMANREKEKENETN